MFYHRSSFCNRTNLSRDLATTRRAFINQTLNRALEMKAMSDDKTIRVLILD